ncbi:hypothetical protein B5807_11634 [Epicoccum nigrum]|uniref:Uncharacterized protein n=1 Tax=Epicoccum nigrum TaxID=105696 RepID=A0A1Y2LJP2_EPING|nr:hypothetical protein B5807_11634 [Epicoccum nigrum]
MAPTIDKRKRYDLRKRPTAPVRRNDRQHKCPRQAEPESARKQPASSERYSVLNEVQTGVSKEASQEASKQVLDRDAITVQNQMASPLLRLPGELRNKIYRLVGEKITLGRRNDDFSIYGKRDLPLLLICRQIKYEVSNLLPVHQVLRMEWGYHRFDLRELYLKHQGRTKPSIRATHEVEIHYTFFGILGFMSDFDPDRDSEPRTTKPELLAMFPELQRIKAFGTQGKVLSAAGLKWLKDLCCGDHSGIQMLIT